MANNYLQFDGVNDAIALPWTNGGPLDASIGALSFAFWMKISGTPTNRLIYGTDSNNGIRLISDGTIEVVQVTGQSSLSYTADIASLYDNAWHHVICVKSNATTCKFWFDGSDSIETTGSGNGFPQFNPSDAGTVYIGRSAAGGNYFKGSFDQFIFAKYAMTTADIAEIYNGGIGKKYADMTLSNTPSAVFEFDEGYGTYILDSAGGLVGTLTGATWASGGVPFGTATMVEQGIYYLLSNDADIAALTSTRIYPATISQDAAVPSITYQQISGSRDHDMVGAIGYATGRFQINCIDDDYAGARALANKVRLALDGYIGSESGIHFHRIFLLDESDLSDFSPESETTRLRYGKRLDFEVCWNEIVT